MLRRTLAWSVLACTLAGPVLAQPATTVPTPATPAAPPAAAPAPMRLRGTVQSVEPGALTMETRAGDAVHVALANAYAVTAIVPTTLASIQPGSMIGVVGFGPPTKQRAAAVTVFPPDAKVTPSQFPWDTDPGSVMTNAPVTSAVVAASGRVLTVTVKGEPIEVTVPDGAVIQALEPGTAAMVVPGAHVLIFAQRGADGVVSANRVNVGKDGFTPAN